MVTNKNMTIERKLYKIEKVEKKKTKTNIKKIKNNSKIDNLPNAIIEGKFVGAVESKLIVSRFRDGKETLTICTVKQIDETGLIHTWDETLQHWFTFPISEAPKIVKLMN